LADESDGYFNEERPPQGQYQHIPNHPNGLPISDGLTVLDDPKS
jgi:hypothetical protein